MRTLVAVAMIYSSIAIPVLMLMGRLPEASVHMIATYLAYSWWSKK
jgi:hypothetical protein